MWLPAFQLPMFPKCHSLPEKRFMRHRICLRNPFLPFLLGIPSIQPLPEATASCPSLHCSSKKKQSHAQKQRVWSLSCGLQDFLQRSDCALCVLLLLQTNDSFVEIELLATVSWTCGCQPFSCRCSQNVTHCPKEICWTCFSLVNPWNAYALSGLAGCTYSHFKLAVSS